MVTATDPKLVRRAVAAAAIGNITEWYDFGVYSYLTGTLSAVFFPNAAPGVAAIQTLGVFAAGFLVRPFGGLLFGPLGDRIGRRQVLALTVTLMAASTFCIGVVPSYAVIGIAAPLLMMLAKMTQGFSTGGEYSGAMTFIAEYAPDKRRGFLGSWLEFGTLTGYCLGAVLSAFLQYALSAEQMQSWGWRLPFLIAGPLGIVGLYLRMRLEETPAFETLAREQERREAHQTLGELRTIVLRYWPAVLTCMGLVLAFNVTNYMFTNYVPAYLDTTLPRAGYVGVSQVTAQMLQVAVMLLMMLAITGIGRLSDVVGRKPVVLSGCIAMVVLALPSVLLLRAGDPTEMFAGLALMGLMLVCFSATMPSTLPALFPTEIRYGSLAIAFNVSVSLFGGSTGAAVGGLVHATGDLNWPAYYLMAAGLIGIVALRFTGESARRPLPGSPPAVASQEEADAMANVRALRR